MWKKEGLWTENFLNSRLGHEHKLLQFNNFHFTMTSDEEDEEDTLSKICLTSNICVKTYKPRIKADTSMINFVLT